MRRKTCAVAAICVFLSAVAAGKGRSVVAAGEERSAAALEGELERVGRDAEYWPGYDPLSVPLAVYDGAATFLFRHPSPPEGFTERGDSWVFEGRYPSVVANSSAAIGGVATATVMLESLPKEATLREWAAVVVHEGFHVFQATTGRRWGANEVDLFTYPVGDADLLVSRRLETEALRRALSAPDGEAEAGWARCALGLRRDRFGSMDPAFRSYERGIETMEGTAAYVEHRAAGRAVAALPEGGFDAEDVRSRAYMTGAAWALLLDRFDPSWRDAFGAEDTLYLDASLDRALGASGAPAGKREFAASERAEIARAARSDAERVRVLRKERRREFESLPGWSVVVETDEAHPLWPQGFDPLNVRVVEGGVLHTRFLRLGGDGSEAEVMGRTALTEGVGPHPLFNGVLRLTLTGLEKEPSIDLDGERVLIHASGFDASFTGARLERRGTRVLIRLSGSERSGENK